jgi:Ferric reductase like transmembrane component
MSNPSPFWYAARGAGVVSLVLLTAVMVFGILLTVRWSTEKWPRFLSQTMHRYLALLAVVFLAAHVITAVLDPFAHLGIKDAVVPFASSYRPFWIGLGVLSVEVTAALIVTSLLRAKINFRVWKLVHWMAYLSWPFAVLHSMGTGTDTRAGWALLIDAACVVAVLVALTMRLSESAPGLRVVKGVAGIGAAVGTVALAVWVVSGPLQAGWARAAGTPASLLASQASATPGPAAAASPSASPKSAGSATTLPANLDLRLTGTVNQNQDGSATITLGDGTSDGLAVTLSVPADGFDMPIKVTQGAATLCSATAVFDGRTVGATCGSVQLTLQLRVSEDGGLVRAVLTTSPAGAQ